MSETLSIAGGLFFYLGLAAAAANIPPWLQNYGWVAVAGGGITMAVTAIAGAVLP